MMRASSLPKGKADSARADTLPPDSAILIDARIKAGDRSVQLRSISNLILHDPVLTLEFLQHANSTIYSGAPVSDVETALTRMGTGRIVHLLAQLNSQVKLEESVMEMLEVLRYNCRRVSIVALIVAAATRPNLTTVARVAGLFADLGHMLALLKLGKTYCDLAKEHKRKNLAYRLQKDQNLDVNALRLKMLGGKGMPRIFQVAFNPAEEAKGSNEAEIRCIIQAAQELIDAYDSGKMSAYSPEQGLPVQSSLRLLGLTSVQHQRVFKAVNDYLKTASEEEAPEGAAFLCTVDEEETKVVGDDQAGNGIRVPVYPHTSVNARSRDRLQDFFVLCEQEKDLDLLKQRATEYLARSGLFKRTALIRIDVVGENAAVDFSADFSAGLNLMTGAVIPISSASSPFAAFTVQIKSTRIADAEAPFGVSAFAMGPLDVTPGGERQVLYADVVDAHVLSMESRRVFRLALGLLVRSVQTIRSAPMADSPR